jgi:hypothetical protein
MANENSVKDDNNDRALLVHNAAGTETRKLRVGPNGGLLIESVGGSTPNINLDVDESEDQVGAAGDIVLTGYYISNRASSERFIKFYEGTVASVVVGTTVPKLVIPLAAAQSANLSGLSTLFTGGLVIAATTGVANTDTGAPAANEIVANVFTRSV